MFKFENLDAWKVSLELYSKVADASKSLRRRDHQFLIEQIMRATLSISANIAEGTGREGIRESKQFFNIAKGSVYEVEASPMFCARRAYYRPRSSLKRISSATASRACSPA